MKKTNRNFEKPKTIQDLKNLKLQIDGFRQQVNQDLDTILKKIDNLLPPLDEAKYQKFKNYVPEDWRVYLK